MKISIKKTLTIIRIIASVIALIVFNILAPVKNNANIFTEAEEDNFRDNKTAAGELTDEKSINIKGPIFICIHL